MDIYIFESELRAICQQTSKSKFFNMETGGDLYGTWTYEGNPIVFLAVGPGPMSLSHSTKFAQDNKYVEMCEKTLFYNFGLQYIGDWHSHHSLGLFEPSSGDRQRITNLLASSRRNKMVEFIINHDVDDRKQRINSEIVNSFVYLQGTFNPYLANLHLLQAKTSIVRKNLFETGCKSINLMEPSFPFKDIKTNQFKVQSDTRTNPSGGNYPDDFSCGKDHFSDIFGNKGGYK